MTVAELGCILKSIDAALEIYRRHQGPLTATEVSMKSMLSTLRSQMIQELEASPLEKIPIKHA
jgi:hypothetical protein